MNDISIDPPRPRAVYPFQALTAAAATLRSLVSRYPLATFSATGLALGAILPLYATSSARLAFAAVAIGGGIPLAWTTLKNMLHGRFYVDTIATLAILGCIALGEYMAGALVVLMQSGGEALEDYGLRRANRSLDNLLRRAPSVAHRRTGTEFVDVPAAALEIGDVILIRPGDIIAADGLVVEGEGSVDEAALTGEPVPLAKRFGDRVFSGTINLTGSFQVRTASTAAESKYERIVRMVQQAQGERAPINRLANQYTPYFTLLTLSVGAGVLLAVHNPVRALAVLVVATPCPLIIATPLAVLSAINRAASLNIILKSGAAIEQAGGVDTVLFDKTGTLTLGEPTLMEIRCFDAGTDLARQPDCLLQGVASVELHSSHVLAGAVVRAARARGLSLSPAADVVEMPGTGVMGQVGESRWMIGSGSYMRSQGIDIPDTLGSERIRLGQAGKTIAYVAVNGRLIGLLTFADPIRPEAAAMLRRLRELNVTRTVMLTGDAPETARAVASQVGIEEVRARLQPEEKLAAIRAFSNTGRVMMVGDGINDAPALAAAHVGVAMGGYGAGIATDAAEVVITVENVERVADTIALGRRMVTVARQGILLGIGASVVLMILASLGYIAPAAGAVCQEVLDLATILNALRAGYPCSG